VEETAKTDQTFVEIFQHERQGLKQKRRWTKKKKVMNANTRNRTDH
jgi:hypothetical protein